MQTHSATPPLKRRQVTLSLCSKNELLISLFVDVVCLNAIEFTNYIS